MSNSFNDYLVILIAFAMLIVVGNGGVYFILLLKSPRGYRTHMKYKCVVENSVIDLGGGGERGGDDSAIFSKHFLRNVSFFMGLTKKESDKLGQRKQ